MRQKASSGANLAY